MVGGFCALALRLRDKRPAYLFIYSLVWGELQAAWQQKVEQSLQQLERQLDQQVDGAHVPAKLAGMEQALRQLQSQADAAPTHSTLGSLRTHGGY